MAELKSKGKPPPEMLKRSERLKSRKRKKDVPTSPAYSETKDARDEDQSESAAKKSSSKSELSDEARSPHTKDSNAKATASGKKSPEPNCAICLSKLENKSFTDSCFHMFCFVCLQEWSKIKPECPLCKQPFKSIIHNVRSYEDYDQYHLERQERSQATWDNPDGRRFRYRTTVTQEHIYSLRHYADLLQWPSAHGSRAQMMNQVTTRQNWRRQRQVATSEFRSRIYRNGLRVKDVADANGRQRDISPSFFAANPAAIHRLIPWLNRELNALLQNHEQHVQFLIELITGLIKRFDIESEEFFQHVYPFIGRHTRHFMYEFKSFAKSPFSMTVYDTKARYEQQTHSVSDSETDESGGNDSDIMIISPSASTGTIGANTVVPSHSRHTRQFEPPAERRWFEIDVTPRTDNLRDLLEDSSLPGQSGWESPTPGPSGRSLLLDALTNEAEDSGNHASRTDRKTSVIDARVKVEGETERSQVINSGSDSDSGSSSDVIFVGFDRPWQERSPLLISSDEESGKDDKKPKCETEIHSKTKISEQNKSIGKRSRNESYSSDEHYSNVSSYSRHQLSHSSSYHRRGRYRSPSYTRSKEDRPSYYSRYQHKKFSQKRRRYRSSRSSSADEFDDYRHSRRSVSTTSKSSRHSSRRDCSYHDRYVLERSSQSHSKSPSYRYKREDYRKDRHRSHTSQCKSRDLTSGSKDYHSKHKKHKKHKHKSRHEKQKSHRRKERRSKDNEKCDPSQSHLAVSDFSRDEQYEKEMCKNRHVPSGEQIRSKIVVPNREIEYSDVSDDSESFSAQTRFKKHPSGHKKSRANVENHSPAPSSSSSRNFTSVRSCHETAESDQSDAALLPEQKSSKSSSFNESTNESDVDSRDTVITHQHETISNAKHQNQPGSSEQKEHDSAADASMSSNDSGVAPLKVLALRKSPRDLLLLKSGEGSKNTLDNKETNSVDTAEILVSTTNIDEDCSLADEVPVATSMTELHLNKNINEFSNSAILDTFGLTSNSFTDARLSLEQLFQTPNSETAEAETVTIDSSSDDDSICVSSSSVYMDTASFPEPEPSGSLSLNVLDNISSILSKRGNRSVLPGSTSDKPCNIESDDQIEINSDSEEETVTVDFFARNSRSAVKSKSRRKPRCEIVDSESETSSSCHSTQRGHFSKSLNTVSESSKYFDNGQVRSSNIHPEIDHIAVNPSAQRSTSESEVSSEDKPLDLSAQCEVNHIQTNTDNLGSMNKDSDDTNQPNTSVDEGSSEESSSDRCISDEALDLRAKTENSHPVIDRSEINSVPNAKFCNDDVDSVSAIVTAESVVKKPLQKVQNCNSEHSNELSSSVSVVNNCDESSVGFNRADAVSSLEHSVATSSSVNTNFGLRNICETNEKSRCGVSKNMDPFLCDDHISNEIQHFEKHATVHEYDCCDSSDTQELNMVQDIPSENYHRSLLPEWCQDSLPSSSCVDVESTEDTAQSCSVAVGSSLDNFENFCNGCSSESTKMLVLSNPNVESSSTCSFTNGSSRDSSSTISVANSLSGDSSSTMSVVSALREPPFTALVLSSRSESMSPSAVAVGNNHSESPSAVSMTNGISESSPTISVVNSSLCTSSTSLFNDVVASSLSDKHIVVNCSLMSNTTAHLGVTDHSKEGDEFQDPNSQMIPDSQQEPEVHNDDNC